MSKTPEQRFWEKVDKSLGRGPNGDCWLWTASLNEKGYGRFGDKKAHRVAYEFEVGSIPQGLILLHSCDNPACVRFSHLTPGTHLENKHDSMAKKRHAYGENHNMARLNEKRVREIRRLKNSGMSGLGIASLTGINYRTIYHILSGKTWSHVTL